MIPANMTPEYRAALTLCVINAFRDDLTRNGNRYSGLLRPNITSICECLSMSDGTLILQLEDLPANCLPSDEQVALVLKGWKGGFPLTPDEEFTGLPAPTAGDFGRAILVGCWLAPLVLLIGIFNVGRADRVGRAFASAVRRFSRL